MKDDNGPTPRPTRLVAAQRVVKAVAALDVLLDNLRPTDAEAHPDSQQGRAWIALIGAVTRATLRADEVLQGELPPVKAKRPFVKRGRTANSASAAPSAVNSLPAHGGQP